MSRQALHASNAHKAYAIRWLEFENKNPQKHETFGALRELMLDETVTAEQKRALLDKWLVWQWRIIKSDFNAIRDDDGLADVLSRAHAAGIPLAQELPPATG